MGCAQGLPLLAPPVLVLQFSGARYRRYHDFDRNGTPRTVLVLFGTLQWLFCAYRAKHEPKTWFWRAVRMFT